ncbi:MAG: DNA translocase FtsK 4TM domain-containing protein, partial [Steroidobacteraceae bacterium]
MAETTASGRAAPRVSAALSRGLRESAAIALAVVALVLVVALLSFDPHDRGFYVGLYAGSVEVHNRVGPVGAWFASALYSLFGRPAYLLPVMLVFWGVRLLQANANARTGRPPTGSRLNSAVRTAGFLALMVASCALAGLQWQPGSLPEGAGGILGKAVGGWLDSGLDLLGATLLLLAAWMAGAALAFGVSWLTVMDRLGQLAWGAVRWLRERSATARARDVGRTARLERSVAVQASRTRSATRTAPRIEAPAPAPTKSERAERERQVPLFDPPGRAELPPLTLLDDPANREPSYSPEALEAMSRLVELKLR